MSKPIQTPDLHDFTEPVGALRLLPELDFGARAVALTRLALPVGLLAAGFFGTAAGAPVEESTAVAITTCCPPVTL
ncbi:hypothetical protein M8C13_20005 [Crossiella sp. SN42]|uniref:hypothetical protein n=1 Tax=unclassified Crossiella TaxID=2620835 RepID=UPI00207C54A5|nr:MULTISPECIES: hypothetical protein [unclassified Crossiella]MCO1578040.1 hypothetical protein [Crossiella sp. SN42]WHT18399.1 hypothetical protein N8J89_35680 [Crossiella sp. CA-258035]